MTFEERCKQVEMEVNANGVSSINERYAELLKSVAIPDAKNRGVFIYAGDIYYADDFTIVSVMGY